MNRGRTPGPWTTGLPALTVSQVSVSFGGVAALTDVNLVVWPGKVTGLIGPNGAGKTTLFNVISGLHEADRGTVHFFDIDMTGMKPYRRARLGLARTFQLLELFGTLTAGENVQVGLDSTVKWWQWGSLTEGLLETQGSIAGRGRSGRAGGRGRLRDTRGPGL